MSFNTSHVVIYQLVHRFLNDFSRFQYISCCYLSFRILKFIIVVITVSIHLMLLFITIFTCRNAGIKKVSIHLMLLFIVYLVRMWHYRREVSIHLMLLFIKCQRIEVMKMDKVSIHLMLLFIGLWQVRKKNKASFNTSHVVIYPGNGLYAGTRGGVSIHLMLLFIN